MKIKLISINPSVLCKTESNLTLMENNLIHNIKNIKNNINEYYDEIDIISNFVDHYDEDINCYINDLYSAINENELLEKNASKVLKKIQKRKKYLNFIKKINY